MNLLTIIIIILIAGYVLERILDYLNHSRWNESLPLELKDVYNEQEYRKAQQYHLANKKLELVSDTMHMALMVVLLLTGAFGKLDDWAIACTGGGTKATLAFFGVIALFAEIISMPFSIYRTFVIEEHFCFNKTTPALFVKDKIKGYILGILLLGGLISLFTWFYHATGSYFWLYAWAAFSVFMLTISMFYTSLILPIFNKLKPLGEGDLRDKISAYCKSTGFGLSDVYVMDGSKRSAKANAFFSGLGRRKKIVLFDTLVDNHTNEELVSILAHETGHYKLKHTRTGLIVSVLQMGVMLYLFSLFMESPLIPVVMGGSHHTIELGLLAFGILYSPVSMIVSLLVNLFSRKHEFQADAYAAQTYDGKALQAALKKLSVNNLSNLNPHPAYVFFYYSHPPLLERLKALSKVSRTV